MTATSRMQVLQAHGAKQLSKAASPKGPRRALLLIAMVATWSCQALKSARVDRLPRQEAFCGGPAMRHTAARRPDVRTALYSENLFDRFIRVGKSNINKALQQFEDPEKVLDQAVEDMQADLIKVRQSYAQVLANQRKLSTQIDDINRQADEWYKRASLAVDKGDDELAKEALSRRQALVNKAEQVRQQSDSMQGNVDKLYDSVQMLEAKIQRAKEEKESLIARARTAKTASEVNEMLSGIGDGQSSAAAFDRMKDKVKTLETRAEVSQNLLPSGSAPASLEQRFKALESGSKVEDELAMLKGKKALPAGAGASSGSAPESAIDKELAELRKSLKETEA